MIPVSAIRSLSVLLIALLSVTAGVAIPTLAQAVGIAEGTAEANAATVSQSDTQEAGETAAAASETNVALPPTIPLTENDFRTLIEAAKTLRADGVVLEQREVRGHSNPTAPFMTEPKAVAWLSEHGISRDRLQGLVFSVGLAMSAGIQGIDTVRQQLAVLERMEKEEPQEYAAIAASAAPVRAMMLAILDQPPQNIELFAAHEQELRAAME